MNNLKLPATVLSVLIILLFLHLYGMYHHLYLSYWFYDLLTHFLGGVGIALSVFYVLKNPKYIVLITLIAGIVWEIFEVYYDITGWPVSSPLYRIDTTIDIVMDVLGALFVWVLLYKKSKQENI